MNKKLIIPIVLGIAILIGIIAAFIGPHNKIQLIVPQSISIVALPDTIELKVYLENSGSMDAYMCAGSTLKDAVFDYVSDVKKIATTCDFYYINSQIIKQDVPLDNYIKDLTPQSFARAGGDRSNTDLRKMFSQILDSTMHHSNTVSIFISDCILDIPEDAKDFFGNCQVSMKNTFNDALKNTPTLGVQIIKLESTFDGYWYCGKNSKRLSKIKRPYYIWIIGDKDILAYINKKAPIENVIHGIKEYCAYAPIQEVPYDIYKKDYVMNHTDYIDVQLMVNFNSTLQSDSTIGNIMHYALSNNTQVVVSSIQPITAKDSKYSHLINLCLSNPETLKSETISFSYPYMALWVEESNDDTGDNIEENLDKTTGIKYLIKGVAEAYKNSNVCCKFNFDVKNR